MRVSTSARSVYGSSETSCAALRSVQVREDQRDRLRMLGKDEFRQLLRIGALEREEPRRRPNLRRQPIQNALGRFGALRPIEDAAGVLDAALSGKSVLRRQRIEFVEDSLAGVGGDGAERRQFLDDGLDFFFAKVLAHFARGIFAKRQQKNGGLAGARHRDLNGHISALVFGEPRAKQVGRVFGFALRERRDAFGQHRHALRTGNRQLGIHLGLEILNRARAADAGLRHGNRPGSSPLAVPGTPAASDPFTIGRMTPNSARDAEGDDAEHANGFHHLRAVFLPGAGRRDGFDRCFFERDVLDGQLIAAIGVEADGRRDEAVNFLNFFRGARLGGGWLLLVGARRGPVVVEEHGHREFRDVAPRLKAMTRQLADLVVRGLRGVGGACRKGCQSSPRRWLQASTGPAADWIGCPATPCARACGSVRRLRDGLLASHDGRRIPFLFGFFVRVRIQLGGDIHAHAS